MTDKATIRDVAARAGVSATTVSHVLNKVPSARISEETRQRVRQAAAALGYAPSRIAQGLRLQRSQTLGLLGDEIATTPYAGRIILGAQEAASAHGWVLMLMNTGNDPEVERRELRALLQHQVDGVVYATMYHRQVRLPPELAGVPVVLLDARCDDPTIPAVVPDEADGGYRAVRELITYGHRVIGFLTNRDDIPATRGRLLGYRNAFTEAGLAYRPDLVVPEHSDTAGGYRAALALLGRAERPTALFCFNDRMAMGAYRAAAELGLAIPTDLSVISYDNQELIADGLHPGLTTMALPHYEMGTWAVNTMIELLTAPDAADARPARWPVLMPCPIVRRQSVAPPPP